MIELDALRERHDAFRRMGPSLDDVRRAMEVVAHCIELASAEHDARAATSTDARTDVSAR